MPRVPIPRKDLYRHYCPKHETTFAISVMKENFGDETKTPEPCGACGGEYEFVEEKPQPEDII